VSDLVAGDALEPLQRAMYERMTGDATLTGLVTGVFDHVPEDQAYDYVTLGEIIETADNRHDGYGRSILAIVHVWSKARGYGPGQAIKNRIVELFDHQALDVDGQHVVAVRFEQARTLTDPKEPGDIRHIPIRFRIDVEQTESS
jgi:hypothetical protein